MYKHIILAFLVSICQKYTVGINNNLLTIQPGESIDLICHAPIPITWHYSPDIYDANRSPDDTNFDSIKWYNNKTSSNTYVLNDVKNSGSYACVDTWGQEIFKLVVLIVLNNSRDDSTKNVITGGSNLTLTCGTDTPDENPIVVKYWLYRPFNNDANKFEYVTYNADVLPKYASMGYELTTYGNLFIKRVVMGTFTCIRTINYNVRNYTRYTYDVDVLNE